MARTPAKGPPADAAASLSKKQALALLCGHCNKGKQLLVNRPISGDKEHAWQVVSQDVLTRAFGAGSPIVANYLNAGKSFLYPEGATENDVEQARATRLTTSLHIIDEVIELLKDEARLAQGGCSSLSPSSIDSSAIKVGNRVFLVHGHDEAATHETARFLEKLKLEVIILREQPNSGRTIIEKFLDYSGVSFAVVLLTGDDRGGPSTARYEAQKLRARQNVVLELGFFLGRLGREGVCVLYGDGVEIPTDYNGVLFVPFDSHGAWRLKLVGELRAAGLDVEVDNAV